ncbi:hypothetical protein NVP1152O_071 [Vibrio phage 1.152.O._10N.222.46.E1]|uniref:HNH nuclease domain-containing protein n=5 Tax=Nahantvirus 49C7 TaxID=2846601 RepID=A0A2I7RBD7_9CAUD|nr:coil containing protein [Vibrio phage 1.026.O._10N.222.49.C7]AUR82553.1 hypothetical protein NVP1025O_070 [Vibrio phage 1.025.O._10N.222.46.B6]AUR90803.1 hypothetical protein NVP1150O_070 [Vibrio phage 1.150.O._10N.222.46.A6]AUR90976.1 hypothetical protein NVP1152O_071 [Vibrio phage 1.152.O._10N.222.46.E1]AUS02444.1 hypothetical protein NVP2130O_070 [Vibrio phage 2.130.O._10N.222.46.C2]AUR82661.1 coil containing protein [Vibrio phage 1.026.O._10N.222.49.C7]
MDQAKLKEYLVYDPQTGEFTRAKKAGNGLSVGSKAGCVNGLGYVNITLNSKIYQGHQLAWLYMTGDWAKSNIDHKDQNRSNNAWSNLREATISQNGFNRGARTKTGVKNVSTTPNGKFRVEFMVQGKKYRYGVFDTLDEAKSVADEKRAILHGDFCSS